MAFHPDRQITIQLTVQPDHPALLEGLDVWLRLGLISNHLVRQICQEQLACPLPEARAAQVALPRTEAVQPSFEQQPVALTDFLPVEPESQPSRRPVSRPVSPTTRSVGRSPSIAGLALQSFMAEISVIWLLFLGVFLVVVSSGVLAATQWRNFSPVGQYGILFGYTLAFWLASLWTGRQRSLQLTSWMLKTATLLIIPVNFWTMDGFRLWSNPLSLLMSAIAAILLSSITSLLLRRDRSSQLMIPTAIALSWLHWGWSWAGVPFIATYIGTIGAAIALLIQDEENRGVGSGEWGVGEDAVIGRREDTGNVQSAIHNLQSTIQLPLTLGTIAIAIAALLLIARAVLVAQVPVNQLGLAIAVCGWLLCWLARRNPARAAWTRAGTGLLIAAWLVTMTVTPPWQALAISGLGLWLLVDYLRRLGQVPYLVASFLVGLQAIWLVWHVVPSTWQVQIVAFCERLVGTEGMPLALVGIGVFPYILLTVWFAFRLRSWQRPDLAGHAEWLALGLGIVLTALSLANPTVRSLNLVLSTLTLAVVTFSRSRPQDFLIYLTHGVGLAAIASGIDLVFPTLSSNHWAAMLLAGMIAEWIFSGSFIGDREQETGDREQENPRPSASWRLPILRSPFPLWHLSAWHYGLLLSGISYLLLWSNPWWKADNMWDAIWLITPIALTALAHRDRFLQSRLAGWFSVLALFLVQPFILGSIEERLASLGIATVLMLLNTRRLRHLVAALLTVGFGLEFAAATVWDVFAQVRTIGLGVNWLAIATLVLWLLRGWLTQLPGTLARLYRQAIDSWAIALAILNFILLTLCSLIAYLKFNGLIWQFGSTWQYVLAATLMLLATSYRNWQNSTNLGFYGIAWSVELLIISCFALSERSSDELAIANLALAFGTQLVGDWWIGRWRVESGEWGVNSQGARTREQATREPFTLYPLPSTSHSIPSSWHVIPLLFAALGLIIQHRTFTDTTGFYTLAAALVGIGVGRRQPSLKPLTYLSLLGVSVAAYEWLIYQLSQARGGSTGDGLTLLAGLAAALAVGYWLLSRWLVPYLRLTVQELQTIGLLHWILGNGWLLVAIAAPLSSSGQWLWTGITAALAAYALVMGNRYLGTRRGALGTRQNTPTFPASLDSPASPAPPPSPTPHSPLPTPLAWTYAGIIESLITLAYLLRLLLPDALLLDWAGAIAAIIAVVIYFAPWHPWGWDEKPWRQTALVLPAVAVLTSAWATNLQSLFIVAAYYAGLANAERQIRLSYISVALADWAILRLLDSYNTSEPLWYAAVVGVSLLYIAQIDPDLRSQDDLNTRHLLRSLATGLICCTAFYQSEIGMAGLAPVLAGLLAIALQLGFALAGLLLRVRAFLYVGTATFIIQVLWQLWRFVSDYSLLLWTLGILVGLSLIWIAATFEARRAQVSALLQHWVTDLEEWE